MEPEDDEAIAARGYLQMEFGHPDLALEDFRSALKLNPAENSYREHIVALSKQLKRTGS